MDRRFFLQITSTFIGSLSLSKAKAFPPTDQSIRIGLITDLHYANKLPQNGNNRFYRESLKKLSECVDLMNRQNVDFMIELGDFKDQDDIPNEQKTINYLQEIEKEFSRFKGPRYHVLGNHDHDSISKQQFLDNISNSGFTQAQSYYSFDVKGVHFIVLDANYSSDGKEYDYGNYDWKDAFVPAEQVNWLKTDIAKNKKPSVVFIHQRLDCMKDHQNYCPKNADTIRKILKQSGNVILVMQGHYHEGDFREIDDIAYYTMKGSIEGSGSENNNYAILEIGPDLEMKLIGFRKTKSQKLSCVNRY